MSNLEGKNGYDYDDILDYPEPPPEVKLVREINERHGIDDARDLATMASGRKADEGIVKHVSEKWPQPAERYGHDLAEKFNSEHPHGNASEYEREKAAVAVAKEILEPLQTAWNRGTQVRIDFSMLNQATEQAIARGLLSNNADSPAQIGYAVNAAARWGGSLQPGGDPNLNFQPINDSQHATFANLTAARYAVNAGMDDSLTADIHKAGYLTLLTAIAENGYDRIDNKAADINEAARTYGTDSPIYALRQADLTLHNALREHFMNAADDRAVQGASATTPEEYAKTWREYHDRVIDPVTQIQSALGRTQYSYYHPERQPLPEPITDRDAAAAEMLRLNDTAAELKNPDLFAIAHRIMTAAENRWADPEAPPNDQDKINEANQLRFMLNHLQAADQSIANGHHPRVHATDMGLTAKELAKARYLDPRLSRDPNQDLAKTRG